MCQLIERPLVSIITACKNNVSTIDEAIHSVVSQTYQQIEYIIVDANSTDGSSLVIDKYRDHISLYIREADQGIADAWNKGIARATGQIIGIINADDCYSVDAVEAAVSALHENPSYGFVFGNLDIIDSKRNYLYTLCGNSQYSDQIEMDMPSIPHPTVFVRRCIYQQFGGFNLSYKTALDYEFLLKLYKCGVRGIYLNKVLATMMIGGESDINFIRAHREVARASLQYGSNHILVTGRLLFKITKSIIRRQLERLHCNVIIEIYRLIFKTQYKYKKW